MRLRTAGLAHAEIALLLRMRVAAVRQLASRAGRAATGLAGASLARGTHVGA